MMSEGHFLLTGLLWLLGFCLYFLTKVLTVFPVSFSSHQVAKIPHSKLVFFCLILTTNYLIVRNG